MPGDAAIEDLADRGWRRFGIRQGDKDRATGVASSEARTADGTCDFRLNQYL